MNDFKNFYSHFLSHLGDRLHFAAHSHHFWPDVSRLGQLEAWDDAALMNDEKWEKIFSHVIPKLQGHLARMLHLKKPEMIALAPNTHDLLTKALSPLLLKKEWTLLTSDSEFHSFSRQLKRWQEVYPGLKVIRLQSHQLLHERQRFLQEFKSEAQKADAIFISQVFFNSGNALEITDLKEVVAQLREDQIFILDGYHATGALPTDLSVLEGKIYYLGGGYKYLQGGEGVGFMLTPQHATPPTLTGWFAEFGDLSAAPKNQVGFSSDGLRFWGSTFDPSGWYRFNAVWDFFQDLGLGIEGIHACVRNLQCTFLSTLPSQHLLSHTHPLFHADLSYQGHFLTYQSETASQAAAIEHTLRERGVYIDRRGDRLRFGFGLYQSLEDVAELVGRLKPST
jgi:selenocysteine lyase/cysteine desulfurase